MGTHVVLSCFFVTMYCIVLLYSIKLTWRQCKVVFRAGTKHQLCELCAIFSLWNNSFAVHVVQYLCGLVVKCKCFLFANYQQHNYCMFLPGIILLTQCYYHRGTRLNAMKRFCICSLWSLLNVLTFFPLYWGMLRRSRRVQLFLSKNSTICIAWLHLQEGHFIFRVMDKSGYTHPFFRQSGGW